MYNIRRQDGELRAGLRSHLASLQPVELVLPRNASGKTRRVVRGAEAAPRLNEVPATEAWDAARTRQELLKADYWPQAPPPVLQVCAGYTPIAFFIFLIHTTTLVRTGLWQ